jgi:hypothetical protein
VAVRLLAVLCVALAQGSPQNPSPMSDSTRPHTRVQKYEVPGRRAELSLGTLYLPPAFDAARPFSLLLHFHGAPWLLEHLVRDRQPQAALVTVQLGAGSRVYADAFADPARFGALITEAAARLRELAGTPAAWDSIVLSSFSAGYGAIRTILARAEEFRRVDAVLLADSLHASYSGDPAAPRATDLPVDETSLEPFLKFAEEAAGAKPFRPYPNRSGSMQYYSVPLEVLESAPELEGWARDAVKAGRRAAGA